jgi:hypothetical protein
MVTTKRQRAQAEKRLSHAQFFSQGPAFAIRLWIATSSCSAAELNESGGCIVATAAPML